MARILVVNDDEEITGLFDQLLSLDGHCVGTFTDGPSALASDTLAQCDVVIMDWEIGNMDGADFLRQLKAGRPEVPVICISGAVGAEPLALGLGVVHFFLKPFDLDVLRGALGRLGKSLPEK